VPKTHKSGLVFPLAHTIQISFLWCAPCPASNCMMGVDDVLQEASRMARQGESTKAKKVGLEILASYHALMSGNAATQ